MSIFKRQMPKARPFKGQFIFSNFSYGYYKQEVPRVLEEQLASLALVGGRNVWANKGALVNQFGYETVGEIGNNFIEFISENSINAQSLLLVSSDDNHTVYRYDTLQGLKQYKTSFPETLSTPLNTYDGLNMFIYDGEENFYVYGGCYEDTPTEDVPVVPESEYYVQVLTGDSYTTRLYGDKWVEIDISAEESKYFWLDKPLVFHNTDAVGTVTPTYRRVYVDDLSANNTTGYTVRLRFDNINWVFNPGEHPDLGEITIKEFDTQESFVWIPEIGGAQDEIVIRPKLMASVMNRLWLVNWDNSIFYSTVGRFDNFEEANGAGYFKGFYNDTSPILSIEEYFNGALITKKNGMYHANFRTNSFDAGNISSTITDYLSVQKINNVAQSYAGDHCVIGDEVIAYDAVSGNLVRAAYVNYLGGVQQGEILLHGEELDSENLGVYSTSKRLLCYNFQEEVLLFYYGEGYKNALVINRNLSIFPREISGYMDTLVMFNQGIIGLLQERIYDNGVSTYVNTIISDFRRGTTIPNISSIAEFEPICLNGNKLLLGSIIEISELNNEPFNISTSNAGYSSQNVSPSFLNRLERESDNLRNMLYSNTAHPYVISNTAGEVKSGSEITVEANAKWTYKKSGLTRVSAPLSGRDGLSIRIEYEPNTSFQLVAINLPDFSRGE